MHLVAIVITYIQTKNGFRFPKTREYRAFCSLVQLRYAQELSASLIVQAGSTKFIYYSSMLVNTLPTLLEIF